MGLLTNGIPVTVEYLIFTILMSGAVVSGDMVKINATQTTYVEVNKSLALSCSYEGNLTPKVCYFWRNDIVYTAVIVQGCIYNPSSSLTITCVGINTVVFTLLRTGMEEHGVKWNCAFRDDTVIKSDYTEIRIKVPVSSVLLSSPTGSQVTMSENSTQNFRCTASASRPIPTLSWFMDNNTPQTTDDIPISQIVSQSPAAGSEDFVATTGSLTYTASRFANGKYIFCQTRDVDGNTMVSNRKIWLDVTFKPDRGPLITNYNNNIIYYAITNKQQALTCTIPGGNPLATITWSCFTGNEENLSSGQMVSKRWTWRASSNGTCTCTSTHLGVDENVMLHVAILSAPTYPKFTLHSQIFQGKTPVKIIGDSTEPIICTAESVPAPDKYTWKYDGQSSPLSRVASLYPSQMAADGRYSCEVGNTMSPTQGQIEYGNSSNYVDIQRLYAPNVIAFTFPPKVEGTTLSVECRTVPGNPAISSYIWQRQLKGSTENTWQTISNSNVSGNHLQKQNISRNDSGTYKCTASNVMKPTAGKQETGHSSQTFELNVLYTPSVSIFIEGNRGQKNVTVREYEADLRITCEVDSNPAPLIQILFDGAVLKNETQPNVTFIRSTVECLHSGIYRCQASNALGQTASSINLFVKCSPRPLWQIKHNVSSPLYSPITLSFSTLAYPEPGHAGFQWYKFNSMKWSPLLSNKDIRISSKGTQSNMTILNVTHSDYGQYRVTVTNEIGSFEQFLFLEKDDVKKDQSTYCSCNSKIDKTGLGIAIALGALALVLGAYSSYVTILMRKPKDKGNVSAKNESTNQQTPYSQFEVESNNDIDESEDNSVKLYTDMVRFSRDDRTIYDVIKNT